MKKDLDGLKGFYKNHPIVNALKDCRDIKYYTNANDFKTLRMRFIKDAIQRGFYKKSIAEFLNISSGMLWHITSDKDYDYITGANDRYKSLNADYIFNYVLIISR